MTTLCSGRDVLGECVLAVNKVEPLPLLSFERCAMFVKVDVII